MTAQTKLLETILSAPPERYDAIMAAAKGAGRARPVTTKAAAAIFGVHPKTLLRYAREAKLTPVRLSKRMVRFDLNEIDALLAGKVEG